MTASERAKRYTSVAIALHWTIAVLILGMIAAGWWMTRGEETGAAAPGTLRFAVFQLHKSVGVSILLLSVARLAWRLFNPPPPRPPGIPAWEKAISGVVHWVFYGLMIVLPLTGWALVSASPTGFPTILFGLLAWPHLPLPVSDEVAGAFDATHAALAWIALALVALHAGAALKHQLFDRMSVLARMGLFGPAEPPARPGRGASVAIAAPLALVFVVYGAATVAATGTRAPDATIASADDGADAWTWTVDHAQSAIAFSGEQNSVPFEGVFDAWSVRIRFNPSDLGSARIVATIDTASARTGDSFVDGSISSASWLDARAHPEAVFEAAVVRSTGPGAYEAEGVLTLKGVSQPLTLPFTLALEDDTAHAEGSAVLDRRAFGLGTDSADNDNAVSPEIAVTVTVEATRK